MFFIFNKNLQITEEPLHVTQDGLDLYLSYSTFMRLQNVRRMGVAKCGSNGRPSTKNGLKKITEPFFRNREQSDAEHVFGTVVLVSLLSDYYPDKFPKEDEIKYFSTMLFHELGEAEGGDIPDDGTRNNQNQDLEELAFVENFLTGCFPPKAKDEKLSLYCGFLEQNDNIGKNAFLIDKFEAILYNLFLEEERRAGSISWRTKHFGHKLPKGQTLSDDDCAKETGSDLPADNWLYALVTKTPEVMSYPAFEVFREIVQSAAFIVRGEEMDWFNAYRYKRNIYTP